MIKTGLLKHFLLVTPLIPRSTLHDPGRVCCYVKQVYTIKHHNKINLKPIILYTYVYLLVKMKANLHANEMNMLFIFA